MDSSLLTAPDPLAFKAAAAYPTHSERNGHILHRSVPGTLLAFSSYLDPWALVCFDADREQIRLLFWPRLKACVSVGAQCLPSL